MIPINEKNLKRIYEIALIDSFKERIKAFEEFVEELGEEEEE